MAKPLDDMGYLILDSRAMTDLCSAMVLDTADTIEEARDAARAQGGGCIFRDKENITEADFVEYVKGEE